MQRHTLGVRNAMSARPDHVNNAETRFFPPVFNQDGGSCGSASRIGYMFSYEMNAFRNLDGTNPQNYYPTHFVWLLTNGNSGKDAFVQHVGVPSAETYGGQTYSKLFGNQEETQNDFGWMTGYDKWYEAMFNRMLKPANFPESTGTDAGREALKNWLWNHNGDESFQSGGLAGVGVAAGTMTCKAIDSTPTNDKLGVTGMKCVDKWGTGFDHALTIVGYDDRIEFDINGNGIYGEEAADERGAWILVNSWGNEWQNGGFVYCPYAYGGSHFNKDGSFSNHWWYPEIYKVRKNYKPQRTIKLKMDYTRRSELYL
uniref:C1 family peptidase n=1 Tax=Prevotellamassilia timonensis TaxID=1852370 RepID=UPI004038EB55